MYFDDSKRKVKWGEMKIVTVCVWLAELACLVETE